MGIVSNVQNVMEKLGTHFQYAVECARANTTFKDFVANGFEMVGDTLQEICEDQAFSKSAMTGAKGGLVVGTMSGNPVGGAMAGGAMGAAVPLIGAFGAAAVYIPLSVAIGAAAKTCAFVGNFYSGPPKPEVKV